MIIADKMTYHDILESGIKEGIFVTSANKDAITKKICWNDNISEVKKKMCLEYKKKKKNSLLQELQYWRVWKYVKT